MTAKTARSEPPIRKHAREQTAALLRRLAFQVTRTSKLAHAEAIHDLRVSIRRFAQCLRVFGEFVAERKAKKIRRNLKALMDLASQVRNRDVALEFLAGAGFRSDAPMVSVISQQRDAAERALRAALRDWTRHHSFRKWRSHLGL